MGVLFYFSAFFSTLFRLASYLFLRVIPARPGPIVLPVLYLLSLTSLLVPFMTRNEEETNVKTEPNLPEKEKTKKKNGSAVKEEPKETLKETTPKSRETSPITQVLFSMPSSSRVRWTNFIINALLALAATDLILTPYFDKATDVVFSRIGAVSSDSVKIVARFPNVTQPVHILWRETSQRDVVKPWKQGPVFKLDDVNDWTDTITLKGLWPSTRYEYLLSDNGTTPLDYPSSPLSFRTFPDPALPGGKHLRFIATSCLTPNFPYVPFQWRTIKGFDLLADYLLPSPPPTSSTSSESEQDNSTSSASVDLETEFMLFLGDFIYADVPIYIGNDEEAYRRLYRRNYQSPSFRKVYEKLPILFAYDDHEFINNYEGNSNDTKPPFLNASSAFHTYNANSNHEASVDGVYYFEFRYGDIAFFVMDTRRYRSEKTEDPDSRTMLGETQLAALNDWLGRVNNTATFKFLMSSVPFTSLWTHDAQLDSWAAYPTEKESLLETLHSIPNVIILSGDRHEFAAVEFSGEGPYKVTEFSTSPLSMFYIPLIRTLQMASETTVSKQIEIVVEDEDGNPINVQETITVPRERVISYVPQGNYKWSTFDVDTTSHEKPTLHLELMVDGKTAYQYKLVGEPVELISSSTAIGAFVSNSVKDLFNKLGMQPGRWF